MESMEFHSVSTVIPPNMPGVGRVGEGTVRRVEKMCDSPWDVLYICRFALSAKFAFK